MKRLTKVIHCDDGNKKYDYSNYNKIAILSEMLKGREVVIMDDIGEEYKSLRDVIETDNNIKPTKR